MDQFGLPVLDVLTRDVEAARPQTLDAVWQSYRRERASGESPFAAASLVASTMDRLGFAFAVAYPAALEQLLEGVAVPSALCVTEANGNSPRAIETRLERKGEAYELCGTKTFVTFAGLAETLLVVARVGEKPDGRPDLAAVRIPASRSGVVLQELAKTPFVPEIPHSSVRFDSAQVLPGERLPGDGYLEYVKPFRTIEDIHVVGATLGYLLGLARRANSGPALLAELSALLLSLDRLSEARPLDPRVHIALHGVYRRLTALTKSDEFTVLLRAAPEDERSRWERDRTLLEVASKAREARFERALQTLGSA